MPSPLGKGARQTLRRRITITVLLLLITCLQISAKTFYQQITLSQKRSPIIKVFEEIKKQTGYRFWYEDKLIAQSKPVDIAVQNATLEQVLDLLFKDQPFSYEIIGKVIAIKEKPAKAGNIDLPPPPDQDKRISGIVRDSLGTPLPGVSYSIKGTKTGGATDASGRFSITVPGNNTILVFSSIGFETREISAGSGDFLNITLSAASTGLSDVVVTALGVKRDRASLGYAISTIKGEELTKAGATMNPFLALYGKASGVGVNAGAAGPQGGIRINIRGAASMNPDQNTRPLFVVDGVIISDRKTSIGGTVGAGFDYGAGINDINSVDIESIEILKGAKATVLYGSDAANGVVLITTKSGRNTRGFGMTGAYQYTIEQPANYLKLQNTYGLGQTIYDTAYATVNGRQTRVVPNFRYNFGPKFDGADMMMYDSSIVKNNAYPNNYRDLFQTGYSSNANVAISGSNEKGSLRASYTNYRYQDIISTNSWQKRNTFSFNGSIKASDLATFEVVSNIYNITSQNRRGMNS
ncbi:SusC/RagA family TonB-linked outer membrane protein [Chitinophaga agrisoli]|nr:SusC/RagA family TonB-linked outer membrane protein [Chitinophaga agrisoli]